MSQAPLHETTPMRRVATASLVGTMIEWYDYFIYGTAAALVFGKTFFPALSEVGGLLASFATFAVGFLVRPIGAAIFGHFGDRVGRKKVLITSLAIMGSGTFLIGLLPPPAVIGAWAPVLLVLLRILQGLGVSGEWGGAQLLVVEYAPHGRRGIYGSFPQIGNVLGLAIATGTFSALTLLPDQQFTSWGWRVPFLASAALLAVALYIRVQVLETPLFTQLQQGGESRERIPIVDLLRQYWRNVLLGMCTRLFVDVQGYIIIAFAVSYLINRLGMSESTGTLATAIAACAAILTAPLFGSLSDRFGRRSVYASGAVVGIALAFPFFWLLNTRSVVLICLAFVLMFAFSNYWCNGVLGTLLAEMFPTRIRYSGTSCTYHLTSIVGGSIAPFIATWLVATSGGAYWPVCLYLIGAAIVSLVAIFLAQETYTARLSDEPRGRRAEHVPSLAERTLSGTTRSENTNADKRD